MASVKVASRTHDRSASSVHKTKLDADAALPRPDLPSPGRLRVNAPLDFGAAAPFGVVAVEQVLAYQR